MTKGLCNIITGFCAYEEPDSALSVLLGWCSAKLRLRRGPGDWRRANRLPTAQHLPEANTKPPPPPSPSNIQCLQDSVKNHSRFYGSVRRPLSCYLAFRLWPVERNAPLLFPPGAGKCVETPQKAVAQHRGGYLYAGSMDLTLGEC